MKTITPEERLNNCSFIKIILMILIVCYHSILYWSGGWFGPSPIYDAKILAVLSKWMNTFHVYGFVLISGYIYRYLRTECGKYNSFAGFINNKAKRLLVPYIFVCLIWVIPITVYHSGLGMDDIFFKFILGTSPSQLWFLLMLFNVFIISYLMTPFWEKHLLLSFLVVMVCYGLSIVGNRIMPDVFNIWTSLRYVLFFFIGFNLRKYAECILWKIPAWIYFIMHVFVFAGLWFVGSMSGTLCKLVSYVGSHLLYVIGAIMIFMVLQKIANSVNRYNKVLKFLSDKSMIVYLFHQQIIYFTIVLFNGVINPWMHAFVNFSVSFGLSLLISVALKKFKFTRMLIGEK